jgi:hypothetical protein
MSTALMIGILVFVAVASGVLLWEGLAARAAEGHAGTGRDLRRARARLAVGAIGIAIVLWIALGLLTRAR